MVEASDQAARADAASDVDVEARTAFVLRLPAELPVDDVVTLARSRGMALSSQDVQTIRNVARMTGGWGEAKPELPASVRYHLMVYAMVVGLLAMINLATTPLLWWFLYPAVPWGMGLVFHYMGARSLQRTVRASRAPKVRPRAAGDSMSEAPTHLHHPAAQAADDSAAPTGVSGQALRPGQRLADRFRIERALGRGGMGEVYVAHDEVLDERVAVKTITSELAGEAAVARFHREAQAARRVTHPNVIRIYDIGRDEDRAFLSMAYVEGQTLGALIDEELQLPFDMLAALSLQVCDGLAAAHAAGITHRDLKPDNVLVDPEGVARIIDFGLAKVHAADGLTMTGAVMGTPAYMSPEQMRGEEVDLRTDIYAMGCILYHAIAGVPPFRRDSAMAVGIAQCYEAPPPLSDYRPDVPEAWVAIVDRAMRKAAEERYPDVATLREAIAAAN